MAYKYSFLDGETYGAEDINSITQRLTGSGVSPFLTKDTYNPEDLNSLTKELVEAGTSINGLKVTLENGIAKIGKGIGFFSSGATVEVDDDGTEVEIIAEKTNYIYAEHNEETNIISFMSSPTKPSDTEYVHPILLAKISSKGVLTDLRTHAKSKFVTAGRNNVKKITLSNVTFKNDDTIYTPDFDYSDFNFMFAIVQNATYEDYKYPVRVFDLISGKTLNSDTYNPRIYYEIRDNKVALCANGSQTYKNIDIYFV